LTTQRIDFLRSQNSQLKGTMSLVRTRRQFAKYEISSPKGAHMDQSLTKLRQREIDTSTEYLKAQRVYLEAAALATRKSETELLEAAKEYRKAAEPYAAALQNLLQYLLAAEPTEAILAELEPTERLIEALDKEKEVSSKLIERHIELIDRNLKLTGQHTEEE
jgi:hypothetical protein